MRKSLLFLVMAVIYGCTCIGQIPTQYVYVDEDCEASLPDFTGMVVVSDNCSIATVSQIPEAGTLITGTISVMIRAMDEQGNTSSVAFQAVILDTIAPTIYYDSTLVSQRYTDDEVMDMYKTFYGWVQAKGDEYNAIAPGRETVIETPDTTFTIVEDSMLHFTMVIPITDYRADEGYWTNSDLDLTAMFK